MKLVRVLKILDHQKDPGQSQRGGKVNDQRFPFADLSGPNRHHHRETAKQQDSCVEGAERAVQVMMRLDKGFRVHRLQDAVGHEQPAEK